MPARKSRGNATGLMASFSVRQPAAVGKRLAPAPLDPEFVARCKASLADPGASISAADVRAELRAHHQSRLKRDA
jgi:hypothetical protein